jgi:hypothetical protein
MTSANSSARLRACFYTTRHNWDLTFNRLLSEVVQTARRTQLDGWVFVCKPSEIGATLAERFKWKLRPK